jgi:hypothetical protein
MREEDNTMATNPNEANNDTSIAAVDPFEKHINIAIEAQDGQKASTDTNAETPTGTETKPGAEAPKATDNKDSTSGGGNDTAQPKPPEKGKEETKPAAGAKDLTLGDGTIVKGGAERRFYEQRETARQEANHYKQQLANTQTELQRVRGELETTRTSVQNIQGMEPASLGVAVTIFRDLQRDPVGTVKKLLAEVKANGHNIDGIGADVDTLAISRMIENSTSHRQTNEPDERQIVADAQAEADRFFTQFPDARPHDALIAKVLHDHPGVDLHTAYFQLKSSFAERGFDWSRSLEDNLREQASSTTTPPPPPPPAPMPNGRGGIIPAEVGEVKLAHENTDMGDIIREAMREQGLLK